MKIGLIEYITKIVQDLQKAGVQGGIEFDIGISDRLQLDNFTNQRVKFTFWIPVKKDLEREALNQNENKTA